MRLFIAINFSDEIKAAAAKVRDQIKAAALRGRFSFDENLHLTLVFIGECSEAQASAIKKVLDDTVFSPFMLSFDTAGCFKREGGDTWWLGLRQSDALLALQAKLSARLGQSGFTLESRKYTPHITLGREVKMPAGYEPPKIASTEFGVTSIELMKSEYINSKLTYTPICSKSAKV